LPRLAGDRVYHLEQLRDARLIIDRMTRLILRGGAFDCAASPAETALETFRTSARLFLDNVLYNDLLQEETWILAHRILQSSHVLTALVSEEAWGELFHLAQAITGKPAHQESKEPRARDPLRVRASLPGSILLDRPGCRQEVVEATEGPASFVLSVANGDDWVASVEIVDYDPARGRLRLIMLTGVPFPGSLTLEVTRDDGKIVNIERDERRIIVHGVESRTILQFLYRACDLSLGEGRVRFERSLPPPASLELAYGFRRDTAHQGT